jgi:hypothetical protein
MRDSPTPKARDPVVMAPKMETRTVASGGSTSARSPAQGRVFLSQLTGSVQLPSDALTHETTFVDTGMQKGKEAYVELSKQRTEKAVAFVGLLKTVWLAKQV